MRPLFTCVVIAILASLVLGVTLALAFASEPTPAPAGITPAPSPVVQSERPTIVLVTASSCQACPAAHRLIPDLERRGNVLVLDYDLDRDRIINTIGTLPSQLPAVIVVDERSTPVKTTLIGIGRIAAWASGARPPQAKAGVSVKVNQGSVTVTVDRIPRRHRR